MQTRGGDGLGINPCLCISLQAVSIDVSRAAPLPICPGSSLLEGQQWVKMNSWSRQNPLQMCADEPGDLSPACDSSTSNRVLLLCPIISCFLNLELSLFLFPECSRHLNHLLRGFDPAIGDVLWSNPQKSWGNGMGRGHSATLILHINITTYDLHFPFTFEGPTNQHKATVEEVEKVHFGNIINGTGRLVGRCMRPGGDGTKGDPMSSWGMYLLTLE